jgi:hypothetical protein
VLLSGRLAVIAARRRLKRSTRVRKLYFEGLAPLRKVSGGLRRRGGR